MCRNIYGGNLAGLKDRKVKIFDTIIQYSIFKMVRFYFYLFTLSFIVFIKSPTLVNHALYNGM